MMIPATLTVAQRRQLEDVLSTSHERESLVSSLSNDGQHLENFTGEVVSGQVSVDAAGDVDRLLSMELIDPRRRIDFNTEQVAGGPLDLSRMIRVSQRITSPLLDEPFTFPIFTGPVSMLEREGERVRIEAQGKEVFGLGASWRTRHIPKKTRKTDALRMILRWMGETRVSLPDLEAKLPKALTINRHASLWKVAKRIAASMDRQLYIDGGGTVRLRRRTLDPVWEYRAVGDHPNIQGPVTIRADKTRIRNAVYVKGKQTKEHKVLYTATAPDSHPLSPERLGRKGAPLYLEHMIENAKIRSNAEARRRGDKALEELLALRTEAQFTAIPNPLQDPMDAVRVRVDDDSFRIYMRSFALPLGQGEMTVGYWKNVGMRRRR